MLRIKPFAAFRPKPEQAARVACVPYDVVNTQEARALAGGDELSFLHVIRPEIDLPDSLDPYDASVYARGRAELDRFKRSVFVRETEPSIYLYRQEMDLLGRRLTQTGVVACCHIDDYANNLIKKHEKTRQDKEDDRTRHVLAHNAHAEPVFFMVHDTPALTGLIAQGSAGPALYDFTAPDGVRHTVWRAPASDPYVKAFSSCPCAYVADGHHRTASAARAGAQKRAANPNHTGEESYNWFMAVLFPASHLTILPYHRVVKDLHGQSAEEFLARLGGVCRVTSEARDTPDRPGRVAMYLRDGAGSKGSWRVIDLPEAAIRQSDPVSSLDYVVLSEHVLGPLLGIGDIRTDKRVDFVGGIRGPKELERRVDSGEMAVAFSMFPTTIDRLMAVADSGGIMPPKSTWFEPKLRSGLLVNVMDER